LFSQHNVYDFFSQETYISNKIKHHHTTTETQNLNLTLATARKTNRPERPAVTCKLN